MKSNFKTVFKKLEAKFNRVKYEAPKILANEGAKVFGENFKNQSFDRKKWKNVQRREPGTFAYKYPKNKDLGRRSRPILIGKTRSLRNQTINSVRYASVRRIKWGNYLPYADKQNQTRTFMGIDNKFRKRLRERYTLIYRSRLR